MRNLSQKDHKLVTALSKGINRIVQRPKSFRTSKTMSTLKYCLRLRRQILSGRRNLNINRKVYEIGSFHQDIHIANYLKNLQK